MDKNKLDLIFKSYDIRGVFNDEINTSDAFKIAKAFSYFVKADEIIIGHDGRISNLEMYSAVAAGVKSTGTNVRYIGLVPTDVVYSVSGLLNLPGIVITASHNPKEYTGLKLCNAGAIPIGENSGLLEIKKDVLSMVDEEFIPEVSESQSSIEIYFDHIRKLVNPDDISNEISFGIDGGNGAIGSIIENLKTQYKLNFMPLYLEVDGNFPNHPADPSDENNLQDLIKLVTTNNLDFGVAFDGDADRAVFIDNEGNVISGSMMTAFIADYLVAKNNQVKVVHNVNVSPHALDLLTKKGVKLIRTKVGHSNIKAVMREENADFGGEHSAHFYYKENFFADSAILTLLVFLNIISEKNQSINEMISAYNFPPSSGEINFKVDNIQTSINNIENIFEGEFDYLDGLSYFGKNFWFNIRGSNTEPKLRVNIEAKTENLLSEVLEKISSNI
jgi:phosphomannomutase